MPSQSTQQKNPVTARPRTAKLSEVESLIEKSKSASRHLDTALNDLISSYSNLTGGGDSKQ
ncbi:MAG: hypothetical protein ABR909_04925 [Candidatus Bathyarchaeia archaeon]|jgi:predicted 2-oxoglutarate/Fe(II)-dependent dioxygenase YbiX